MMYNLEIPQCIEDEGIGIVSSSCRIEGGLMSPDAHLVRALTTQGRTAAE